MDKPSVTAFGRFGQKLTVGRFLSVQQHALRGTEGSQRSSTVIADVPSAPVGGHNSVATSRGRPVTGPSHYVAINTYGYSSPAVRLAFSGQVQLT